MPIKHPIRKNGEMETKVATLTARTAFHAFCFECMGRQRGLVKGCTDKLCPLFGFRLRGPPKGTF